MLIVIFYSAFFRNLFLHFLFLLFTLVKYECIVYDAYYIRHSLRSACNHLSLNVKSNVYVQYIKAFMLEVFRNPGSHSMEEKYCIINM